MRTGVRYITIIAFVVLAFGAGLLVGTRGETQATLVLTGPENPPENVDLAPVWKAWRLLDEKFVAATTSNTLSEQDRVWGIISGLADAYDDPYTTFLPPMESQSFEEDISGSFGGAGMEIGMREGILTVIAPLKGTPAEAAGIFAGDLILEVNGESTKDMSIDESILKIRGEIGTEVVFTIAREGEREFLTIPVVRDIIEIPTLDTELRDDGVFVISLYNFGGTATREMRRALREFIGTGQNKLLIDLRGNPGGYLEAAVDIASWFLPAGKVVVAEDYGHNKNDLTHRSKGYDVVKRTWDIAILIDGGSASASEILAGALHEHDKAVLIGTQTFGKGSVQELLDITPDTSLKITVARWLTPNGTSLSDGGLTPDLEVALTFDDVEADRDPQLDAAITYLLTGELTAPATTTATSTDDTVDPVKGTDHAE